MMDLLRWITGCVITVIIAALAVMNREPIAFTWSPLHEPFTLPVYFVVLVAIAFGFVFGAVVTWLNMDSLRRTKRQQKKEIKTLEQEVQKLNKAKASQPPAKEFFVALPPKL